jgi:hypothetical protein
VNRGPVRTISREQAPVSSPWLPGLSHSEERGRSARPCTAYTVLHRLAGGPPLLPSAFILGIMLGWSGRHEYDSRAQHRWRGFGPALYSTPPRLSRSGRHQSQPAMNPR